MKREAVRSLNGTIMSPDEAKTYYAQKARRRRNRHRLHQSSAPWASIISVIYDDIICVIHHNSAFEALSKAEQACACRGRRSRCGDCSSNLLPARRVLSAGCGPRHGIREQARRTHSWRRLCIQVSDSYRVPWLFGKENEERRESAAPVIAKFSRSNTPDAVHVLRAVSGRAGSCALFPDISVPVTTAVLLGDSRCSPTEEGDLPEGKWLPPLERKA